MDEQQSHDKTVTITRKDIEDAVSSEAFDLVDHDAGDYGQDGWIEHAALDQTKTVEFVIKFLADHGITVEDESDTQTLPCGCVHDGSQLLISCSEEHAP